MSDSHERRWRAWKGCEFQVSTSHCKRKLWYFPDIAGSAKIGDGTPKNERARGTERGNWRPWRIEGICRLTILTKGSRLPRKYLHSLHSSHCGCWKYTFSSQIKAFKITRITIKIFENKFQKSKTAIFRKWKAKRKSSLSIIESRAVLFVLESAE